MVFHVPAGGYEAVFEGTSAVPISDYIQYIGFVVELTMPPERQWEKTFTTGSPFNRDDFTHFVPGIKYYWKNVEPFDIIT
jgi:hypothetical protein